MIDKFIRRDLIKGPKVGRKRIHTYDCQRRGSDWLTCGMSDFNNDYIDSRLTIGQIRDIIASYFKKASVDIIRKNEIFTWPKLGKIFIVSGPRRKNILSAAFYFNIPKADTGGKAYRFYFQRKSKKKNLKEYEFSACKTTDIYNVVPYGRSGLKYWVKKSFTDPMMKDYSAICLTKT